MGAWNSDWRIGKQIEISKEQIKSRQYNGKTYYTIAAPPEAKMGGGVSWQAFNDLAARVAALEDSMSNDVAPMPEEELDFGEEPPAEENAQMDEAPF